MRYKVQFFQRFISRITWVAGLGAICALTGCVSTASWLTGLEPVTAERCQKMEARQMGFDDGRMGQRQGEKIEFWQKDCAGVGVRIDRQKYDQGYGEGLNAFCSCENGFMSGIKEEFAELKTQFQMCKGAQYKQFLAGHKKGQGEVKNEKLARKVGQFKMEYDEPAIVAFAKDSCSASSAQ